MDDLRSIAETPREQIGDEVFSSLKSMRPEDLAIVIRRASELQPPNDAILGAAVMMAYDRASDERTLGRDEYVEVVKLVFPNANPRIPEREHISRFI